MKIFKNPVAAAGLTAAAMLGVVWLASPAQAAFVIDVYQDGSNVVASGSGSLNLSGLTFQTDNVDSGGFLAPADGGILLGATSANNDEYYGSFTGPGSFGSGGDSFANTGSGGEVGVCVNCGPPSNIVVPEGYISGSALSSMDIWDNTTLAGLGLTDGVYVWTWGSGGDADSLTLDVGAPEPTSLLLMASGLFGLGVLRRRKKG